MSGAKGIPESRWGEFAQMCVDGATVKELRESFGASRTQVRVLRVDLGLADPGGWSHGASAYTNYGCRCVVCTRANRERVNRRRLERIAEPKDPNDPRHGKSSFYRNHGCRCEPCTAANVAACRDYNRRAAA